MNSFPVAGRDPQATVYDINGNPVGTVADIYFDDTHEPAFATAQTCNTEAM